MTVHLVKLSVGSESVDTLEMWVKKRVSANRKSARGAVHDHVTRMHPKRAPELLDGGSIYWVIKGVILCRQKVVGIERVTGHDGIERTALLMAPKLIRTEPQMRKAFQGWRYLRPQDAPRDLAASRRTAIPPQLHAELANLGLL